MSLLNGQERNDNYSERHPGIVVGFSLLVVFAFLGMSIGSLLIGALIIGSVAFLAYIAIGMGG
jgi:hypothetical protein